MYLKGMIVAVAAAAALTADCGAQRRVDSSIAAPASGRVEVHNVAGSVRVLPWSRNEVRVTGELGRGTERVDLTSSGGRTVIRVVLPRNGRNVRGSDIEVRVPARSALAVHAVSADVSVEGLTGRVEAQSVSGEVRITGSPDDVEASSRSGEVFLEVRADRVHASTVSGGVSVEGEVRRSLQVESVSGDVRVEAATPEARVSSVSGDVTVGPVTGRANVNSVSGEVRLTGRRLHGKVQTVSGDIVLEGDPARDGLTELESHSGEITLDLPRGAAVQVDATTFSGELVNEIAGARLTRSGRREFQVVTGRGGGARVVVRTFSGDVRLGEH
jgi:DUF4097 and DUF4098 domain-containing protein YvlB